MQKVIENEFEAVLSAEETPALLFFTANWCGPSRPMRPILEAVEEKRKDVRFFEIDVDESPNLATRFDVHAIPCFVLLKHGKVLEQITGALSGKGFERMFAKF